MMIGICPVNSFFIPIAGKLKRYPGKEIKMTALKKQKRKSN